MAATQSKIHNLMFALAQECGNIETLLDTFFGFMHANTDFFLEAPEGSAMGFPSGVAERMVMNTFSKYQSLKQGAPSKQDLQNRGRRADGQSVVQEERPRQQYQDAPRNDVKAHGKDRELHQQVSASNPTKQSSLQASGTAPDQNSSSARSKPDSTMGQTSGLKSQSDQKKSLLSNAGMHNGGIVGDKYSWEQTVHDIALHVLIPVDSGKVGKGKDVAVSVKGKDIKVAYKGIELISGMLGGSVKAEELVWTLENGCIVSINLEKAKEVWWSCAIDGEAEGQVDTTKVDSSRHISEYDDGVRSAINKAMFDNRQKMQGLPTSDELVVQQKLEQAWQSEDSPFKGQPFDPSKVQFQN